MVATLRHENKLSRDGKLVFTRPPFFKESIWSRNLNGGIKILKENHTSSSDDENPLPAEFLEDIESGWGGDHFDNIRNNLNQKRAIDHAKSLEEGGAKVKAELAISYGRSSAR
jgi:hypothetical protein